MPFARSDETATSRTGINEDEDEHGELALEVDRALLFLPAVAQSIAELKARCEIRTRVAQDNARRPTLAVNLSCPKTSALAACGGDEDCCSDRALTRVGTTQLATLSPVEVMLRVAESTARSLRRGLELDRVDT